MVPKLSSRQQAQLAFLELLAPKLQRMYSLVEQMAAPRVDEAILRALGRLLDDIKGNATALSLSGLAETAGRMGMLLRGGGGLPLKVRGLRELHNSLKMNYDAALRQATTPEEAIAEGETGGPTPSGGAA
jgi:chemotaxis protein histidine kinase CheA